jgi:hypothetical protein
LRLISQGAGSVIGVFFFTPSYDSCFTIILSRLDVILPILHVFYILQYISMGVSLLSVKSLHLSCDRDTFKVYVSAPPIVHIRVSLIGNLLWVSLSLADFQIERESLTKVLIIHAVLSSSTYSFRVVPSGYTRPKLAITVSVGSPSKISNVASPGPACK